MVEEELLNLNSTAEEDEATRNSDYSVVLRCLPPFNYLITTVATPIDL